MKKNFLFLIGIVFPLFLVIESCKKDDNSTPTNTAVFTDYGKGCFKVKGDGNYSFSDSTESTESDFGYLISIKYKNNGGIKYFGIEREGSPTGPEFTFTDGKYSSLKDGWYEYKSLFYSNSRVKYFYKIEATSDYEIEMSKMPANNDTLPQTYSSNGKNIYGPFSLYNDFYINVNCPNTSKDIFNIKLYNAMNFAELKFNYDFFYSNYNINTHQFEESINKTVSRSNIPQGKYYVVIETLTRTSYTIKLQ